MRVHRHGDKVVSEGPVDRQCDRVAEITFNSVKKPEHFGDSVAVENPAHIINRARFKAARERSPTEAKRDEVLGNDPAAMGAALDSKSEFQALK